MIKVKKINIEYDAQLSDNQIIEFVKSGVEINRNARQYYTDSMTNQEVSVITLDVHQNITADILNTLLKLNLATIELEEETPVKPLELATAAEAMKAMSEYRSYNSDRGV